MKYFVRFSDKLLKYILYDIFVEIGKKLLFDFIT